jgi:hypothetical protein
MCCIFLTTYKDGLDDYQLLGLESPERPTSTNKGGTRVMNATTGHVVKGTEILANQ